MSMLAERRRKTKWVINPTKKPLWSTDSNGIKFGKELMEKMGWSAGKGLGAKEQGIQEPLKVSYKNDTKGMGFKGNDDDWIEQQDEFNVLLNQLRSSDDSSVVKISEENKNEIKSLEEKSRQSKARVHYQKFTRGKDLSRYSENDLACILGTNKIKKEKSKTEEAAQTDVKTDGSLETSFGVTTINSGSIQDYFKKKWINDKAQPTSEAHVHKKEEEQSWGDERPSFSMGCQESLEPEGKEITKEKQKSEDGSLDVVEKSKKRKRKDVMQIGEEEEPKSKRRKNSKDEEGPLVDVAINECERLVGNENGCDSSRKRKKDKKHSKSSREESFENDRGSDLEEVKKKKKKKEKKEKAVGDGDAQDVPSVDAGLECGEGKSGKKKKKRDKHRDEVFDEFNKENIKENGLDVSVGEINGAVEGQDGVVAKAKKKKKKRKDSDETAERVDETSMKDDSSPTDTHDCDTEVVHKKKKKKKEKQEGNRTECYGQQNGITSDIPDEMRDGESSSKVESELGKKKKKKKDKNREKEKEECGGSDQKEETSQEAINGSSETVKRKKKKDKKEKLKTGGESLVDQQKEESCSGDQSINPLEGESTKKKKKKEKKLLESAADKEDEEKGAETAEVGEGPNEKGVVSVGGRANAEIGVTGVDRVELISQRAAYEHIPGQHTYERVKSMIQWVNLTQFRGSNLENLQGYGKFLKKCETNAR